MTAAALWKGAGSSGSFKSWVGGSVGEAKPVPSVVGSASQGLRQEGCWGALPHEHLLPPPAAGLRSPYHLLPADD